MGISYGVQVEKHNYSPFEPSLGQHFTLWILKSSAAPTLEEVSLQRPKRKDMETRLCEMGTRCVNRIRYHPQVLQRVQVLGNRCYAAWRGMNHASEPLTESGVVTPSQKFPLDPGSWRTFMAPGCWPKIRTDLDVVR